MAASTRRGVAMNGRWIAARRVESMATGKPGRVVVSAGLLLVFAALTLRPAHAGMFDDDEARKMIANLKAQVEAGQRSVDERLGKVDERLIKLDAAVQDRRAIIDLATQLDALKQDIARLRGQNETLINQTENLERRQRDLYVDLDARLRKLEQAQVQLQEKLTAPEREAAKEKETYEAALNQFRQNNFGAAITAFQGFMSSYSSSALLPSAQYWIGNAHYALRDYKNAIAAQQKVIATWPDNPKASDAMLNIASSQAEMNDARAARETLLQLVKKYPTSPAADQAKQRLQKK